MTPHHPKWLDGSVPPTDFDSPMPVPFLSVTGTFRVVISWHGPTSEKAKNWTELARSLLCDALKDWGIGGKTTSGYGRLADSLLPPPIQPAANHRKGEPPARRPGSKYRSAHDGPKSALMFKMVEQGRNPLNPLHAVGDTVLSGTDTNPGAVVRMSWFMSMRTGNRNTGGRSLQRRSEVIDEGSALLTFGPACSQFAVGASLLMPDQLVLVESTQMESRRVADHFLAALKYMVISTTTLDTMSNRWKLRTVSLLRARQAAANAPTASFRSGHWIANLTGGTKPMSIATYEFFAKALGGKLVYTKCQHVPHGSST